VSHLQSENTKRIARNTLYLYVRMLFSMGISLYTSRLVLEALGVEDYGIYNVVGGTVAMFSILSSSLSASVMRFLTFELGKGKAAELNKVFSTSLAIHLFLAILVFLVVETVGLWFLNDKMNIPTERLTAANWVFQCSCILFVIKVINVPYNASIISHEKMIAFAYIGMLEIVLKLLTSITLIFNLFPVDKLIIYGLLLMFIGLLSQLISMAYCNRHFAECTYRCNLDYKVFKEILGFAGWNFIGCTSLLLKDEGINVLLNLFWGSIVNAARAISYSVNGAITSFITNFMTAINPQIVKSYSSGDYNYMMLLVKRGTRFSFYILLMLALPVLFETDFILKLWLNVYPDHTANFVRLVLILSMCDALSNTLITSQLATGKIRNYQIVVGGILFLNFPLSYLFLKMGYVPEVTMIIAIVISICCLFFRLIFLRKMIKISISDYLREVVGNVFLVSVIALIFPLTFYYSMPDGAKRFILLTLASFISSSITIYLIGCSKSEQALVSEKISAVYKSFLRRIQHTIYKHS